MRTTLLVVAVIGALCGACNGGGGGAGRDAGTDAPLTSAELCAPCDEQTPCAEGACIGGTCTVGCSGDGECFGVEGLSGVCEEESGGCACGAPPEIRDVCESCELGTVCGARDDLQCHPGSSTCYLACDGGEDCAGIPGLTGECSDRGECVCGEPPEPAEPYVYTLNDIVGSASRAQTLRNLFGEVVFCGFSGPSAQCTMLDSATGDVSNAWTVDGNTRLLSAAAGPDGDLFVGGGHVVEPGGSIKPWIGRFDSEGNLTAQSVDMGFGGDIRHLTVDTEGNAVGADRDSIWRTDSDGAISSRVSLGATVFISDIEPSGTGFVVVGSDDGEAFATVIADDLSVTTAVSLPGPSAGQLSNVVTTSDGYYVSGFITQEGEDQSDHWVLELDPDLAVVWQTTIGTSDPEYPGSLALSGEKLYTVGTIGGQMLAVRLDPATGEVEVANAFDTPTSNASGVSVIDNDAAGVILTGTRSGSALVISADADLTVEGCASADYAGTDVQPSLTVADTGPTAEPKTLSPTTELTESVATDKTAATGTASVFDRCE